MLNILSKKIHESAVKQGFYDDTNKIIDAISKTDNINNKLSNIINDMFKSRHLLCASSELGEANEAIREGLYAQKEIYHKSLKQYNHHDETKKTFNAELFERHIKDSFEDEIADCMIWLLDLCERESIDIEWHINQKMKYNSTREKRHGKQY